MATRKGDVPANPITSRVARPSQARASTRTKPAADAAVVKAFLGAVLALSVDFGSGSSEAVATAGIVGV